MKPGFVDEENFLIAFYCDKEASSTSRLILQESARVLIALGFFVKGSVGGDPLWSIAAFGILLWGDVRRMLETLKYTRVFRSILTKYDDTLTASTSRLQGTEPIDADQPAARS